MKKKNKKEQLCIDCQFCGNDDDVFFCNQHDDYNCIYFDSDIERKRYIVKETDFCNNGLFKQSL